MPLSGGAPLDMTASSTPNSRKAGRPLGISPSPHGLSRGKSCLSRTITRSPRRAAKSAAAAPEGPAPFTATSGSGAAVKVCALELGLFLFGGLGRDGYY